MTESVKTPVKKIRKKNALETHKTGECGCSIMSNPNNCIYQPFLDGWEFTPDVGNGQKRGEVFTPLFIVNRMIENVGMIPKEAVYEHNYTTLNKEELEKVITSKVLEPAVGTGNYISTILWHKLNYAFSASLDENTQIDPAEYDQNVLKAVSSIYIFDIDPGNLETTYQRLLRTDATLNNKAKVDKWTKKIKNGLDKTSKTTASNISSMVKTSLNSSEENWNKFLISSPEGIVQSLYKAHMDTEISEEMMEKITEILDDNVKLFNGIVKEDTVEEGFVVPGWKNVVWRWWNIDEGLNLSFDKVRLADQMISGEIEKLQKQADELEKTGKEETDDGLFSVLDWRSDKERSEFDKLNKRISDLKKELSV